MIWAGVWDEGDIWANFGCFNPEGSGMSSIYRFYRPVVEARFMGFIAHKLDLWDL